MTRWKKFEQKLKNRKKKRNRLLPQLETKGQQNHYGVTTNQNRNQIKISKKVKKQLKQKQSNMFALHLSYHLNSNCLIHDRFHFDSMIYNQ